MFVNEVMRELEAGPERVHSLIWWDWIKVADLPPKVIPGIMRFLLLPEGVSLV